MTGHGQNEFFRDSSARLKAPLWFPCPVGKHANYQDPNETVHPTDQAGLVLRGQLTISRGVALLYTSVTPLLNPFIYTLRNGERSLLGQITKEPLFLNKTVI